MDELGPQQEPTNGLTLREAATELGVTTTVLRRMIRSGELPEAVKVKTPEGRMWQIPMIALENIASRQGWVIDVTRDNSLSVTQPAALDTSHVVNLNHVADRDLADPEQAPEVDPTVIQETVAVAGPNLETAAPDAAVVEPLTLSDVLDTALLDRMLGVKEEAVRAQADADHLQEKVGDLAARQAELERSLDAEQTERADSADRYQTERTARAVAEAQVTELQRRVAREVALADAERSARDRANERSLEREWEIAQATASMGWLSRRRYRSRVREQQAIAAHYADGVNHADVATMSSTPGPSDDAGLLPPVGPPSSSLSSY